MLSNNIPLDSHLSEPSPLSSEENLNIRVNLAQVEQLRKLGVLDEAQTAAGRRAGGLLVSVSSRLVKQFQQENESTGAALEKLAGRIHAAGLSVPARLFLTAGRPLSFFGSQVLLLAQPVSKLLFRNQDPAGHYYRLLEDRQNVDRLLRCLDALESRETLAKRQAEPEVSRLGLFSSKKERTR
ncbi:MAG: hypothetical protein JWP00_3687 [Chloroflexi bacterium]|nr:hypothetical protein [Chloroflexota bacterium]